ncbi:MAG: DUF305 domain-containing protein [Ilumatobacteraceae bacterium]
MSTTDGPDNTDGAAGPAGSDATAKALITVEPQPAPSDSDDAREDKSESYDDDDDEVVVLAWWHNPVNLIAIALGLILVIGSLGWVLGNNHALPDPNSADVGFLQDMRWHHEQAVLLSFTFLADANTDPALRQVAQEIIIGQELEVGMMVQLLRDFGKPESNETDTGMVWMDHPTPLDQMPGMANQAQITQLDTVSGAAANQLFVQLMVAHHQGGIYMADAAVARANVSSVRTMASQMSGSQAEEIIELNQLLAASQKS